MATSTSSLGLLPDRARSEGTHRRLLEQALILFGERGFHGVSVRDIAEAAGIRAPSIYKHLESKEELLFQLLLTAHEEHRARLRAALLEAGNDPVHQIRSLTHAHVLFHAELSSLARVANRELHALTPENAARVQDIRDDSTQIFIDVIDRGIELGDFNVHDSWLATAAIGAMGLRVAEWWGRNPNYPAYPAKRVAEEYATFAVRLLVARDAARDD
jgi:AcrR family transcriptional regulator